MKLDNGISYIYHINIYFTFEGFLDIVEKQIVKL